MVPVTKKDWTHANKHTTRVPGYVRRQRYMHRNQIIQPILPFMESKSHSENWPVWEVFIRARQGLDHKHAGSLYAADAQMAIENARDVYTRRNEGISIWVVESKWVHASNPDESDSLYDPANDKMYRLPGYYQLPDELKNM